MSSLREKGTSGIAGSPQHSSSNRVQPWARLSLALGAAGDVERAARCALVAADQAAKVRAYRTATELYQVALSVPLDNERERPELLERVGGRGRVGRLRHARPRVGRRRRCPVPRCRRAMAGREHVVEPSAPSSSEALVNRSALGDDAIRLAGRWMPTKQRGRAIVTRLRSLRGAVLALADERTDEGMEWASAAGRRLISSSAASPRVTTSSSGCALPWPRRRTGGW